MYVKRIQILNYGPIDHLDLELPFEEDRPKPVLLIGENGSGKSIVLSHIVNGLILARDRIYPITPEVETNRVYKLRSSSYIKLGQEVYFARGDFEEDLQVGEIRTRQDKGHYSDFPGGPPSEHAEEAWKSMPSGSNDHYFTNILTSDETKLRQVITRNCMLSFPPNRFEEPAWLNEENLKSRAAYMGLKNMVGQSERRLINYAPLRDNQNWLFEVVYDRVAFETKTASIQSK